MLRRILLTAFGCAALGILACSHESDAPIAETKPVTPEPVLTAPDVSSGAAAETQSDDRDAGTESIASTADDTHSEPAVPDQTDRTADDNGGTSPAAPAETTPPAAETAATSPTEADAASTEPENAQHETVDVDPILDGMFAYYAGLHALRLSVEMRIAVTDEDGKPLPVKTGPPHARHLTIAKPNRFYHEEMADPEEKESPRKPSAEEPQEASAEQPAEEQPAASAEQPSTEQEAPKVSFAVASNGREITGYSPEFDRYVRIKSPPSFPEILESNPAMMLGGRTQVIPFVLMEEQPRDAFFADVVRAEYVGRETVGDVPAHRIRFTEEHMVEPPAQPGVIALNPEPEIVETVWEIWIAAEADPVVLQTSRVRGTQPVLLRGQGPTTITISLVETYKEILTNPELSDADFEIALPDSATRMVDVGDLLEPLPLFGEEAPEVVTALYGGGEMNLSQHKGRDIVMLDFWATWCGPCREELPTLVKIADEYRDRGVVFYAVNLQEPDPDIALFLEESGLKIPAIAKDADGEISQAFGVQPIPHLVLIGKDGIVQAVHIGVSPIVEQKLRWELNAMVAGESIAHGIPEKYIVPEPAPESSGAENAPDAAVDK